MADAKGGFRPGRPSVDRAAVAEEARRFAGEDAKRVPLKIMVSEKSRQAIHVYAVSNGTTMKRLFLTWAQEHGIKIDPADLKDDKA